MDRSQISRIFGQLARFGVVGLTVNVALYLVYIAFTWAGIGPITSSTLVFAMGIPISLFGHSRITFRVSDVTLGRKAVFAGGYVLGYAVQIGTLSALHLGLGLPHQLSQLMAMIVVALSLFVYQKTLVFQT